MLSQLLGGLGHIQALQFTGMGGPMGVYESYDTYAPRTHQPLPPPVKASSESLAARGAGSSHEHG